MSNLAISSRANLAVRRQDKPWPKAPSQTYSLEVNPGGLISFGDAENAKEIDGARARGFGENDLTYGGVEGGGPDLPAIWAAHINEYLKTFKPISASNVQLTGCSTSTHDILAWALAEPGDVFLTSRPVYGRYEIDLSVRAGVEVHYADTDAETCFNESVVDNFEAALQELTRRGAATKAVLIVNPHNPLGRCYPKETLIALMKFCSKHRLHLISDEIFACSVFPGDADAVEFTSVFSVDADQYIDPNYLHVSYGFSKSFGAAGLNVGSVVTRNEQLIEAFGKATQFTTLSGANIATARAILGDRERCRYFVNKNKENLARAHRHATDGLERIGVQWLKGCNAGFFLWIDLSPHLPDHETPELALAQKLVDAGVFLNPKEEHGPKPGWYRLIYTQDPATVTEGLRRLQSVIGT